MVTFSSIELTSFWYLLFQKKKPVLFLHLYLFFYLTINFEIMGPIKGPRGKDIGNPFNLLMRKQEAWKSRMIEAG